MGDRGDDCRSGLAGGLWLSRQFLRRIDAMRLAAQAIMAGDWSRRIPLTPIDDDLSALARTFNRLFGRIEKLLLANKHVSADIAHDLRKPLASVLRRLEAARAQGADSEVVRSAVKAAIAEIENLLETFNALLRIGQVEAGARRAGFRPLDLAEIAREVVEAFQPAAEDEGKTLALRLDDAVADLGRQGALDPDDRELDRQCFAARAKGRSHRSRWRAHAPRRTAICRGRRAGRRPRELKVDL